MERSSSSKKMAAPRLRVERDGAANIAPSSRRAEQMMDVTQEFHRRLTTVPGIVLSGELRLAVAKWARTSVFDREGGRGEIGGPKARLKPGGTYGEIRGCNSRNTDPSDGDDLLGQEHNKQDDNGADGANDSKKQNRVLATLRNLVYTAINPQSRVDAEWFRDTIRALDGTGLVPDSYQGEARSTLLLSLYCETVCFATVSHGIHVVFLAIQGRAPELPTISDAKVAASLKPTFFDIRTMLGWEERFGRPVRAKLYSYLLFSKLISTWSHRVCNITPHLHERH